MSGAELRGGGVFTPSRLLVAVAGVAAARLGLRPVSDNSTLVHLRTGLEILRTGRVAGHDPYSFTAAGHPWVVQSWLASVLYAGADRINHQALVLEQGLVFGILGVAMALCARSTTVWRWGVATALAIAASAPGWSPRPLMFGLVCLGLTILVTERRAHPLWLVPIVWVWVNSHGSFPLGLAWLGARVVGETIDRRGVPRDSLLRLGGFAAGLAVAAANPVGLRLLTFPLVALHKKSTFQGIVEWHSPNFQDPNTFLALVFVIASLVVLLRQPLPWAQLLPVCGFLTLALIAARNLGPLGVTLAPALGSALAVPPTVGMAERGRWGARLSHVATQRWWRLGAAAGTVTALAVFAVDAGAGPGLALGSYPVTAIDEAAHQGRLGPAHRIVAVDVVGCYIVWRAGPATKVFIDDRYDMYPRQVTQDAATIGAARDDVVSVLDRWKVDTVVWSTTQALPQQLLTLGGWRETWRNASWALLVRDDGARPA